MTKFLVLLAEGFEETEAVTVIDVLRRGGVEVSVCSLVGLMVEGSRRIVIQADQEIDGVSAADYDGLYLPGGVKNARSLRDDARAQQLIRAFAAAGKTIAAICAAPIALQRAGVLEGQRATSNPDFEAEVRPAEYVRTPVVVSGHVLTSRAAGTALPFGLAILKHVGLAKEAEAVSRAMLFDFLLAHSNELSV
ncbi:MAG: DJ-1 family glyoxalase III [Sporolactobacillus sp.]